MTKFERAAMPPMPLETLTALAKQFGTTVEKMQEFAKEDAYNREVYINDIYQVNKYKYPSNEPGMPDIIHLSIKRRDKEVIHDWRDLQAIKNELVSPEIQMWECYPKESELIDTANQYHLWGFLTDKQYLPFGWYEGRKVIDHDPEMEKLTNTKQRKLQQDK